MQAVSWLPLSPMVLCVFAAKFDRPIDLFGTLFHWCVIVRKSGVAAGSTFQEAQAKRKSETADLVLKVLE